MKYNTEFNIRFIPHDNPQINYSIDGVVAGTGLELLEPMTLQFNLDLEPGPHKIEIDFYNKTNDTPACALEIDYVEFEGMRLDRFKWSNRYYPVYPEPWASTQTNLPEFQSSATYLGWNGCWELSFETPIFTWIHRLENLGWIYD
jgi:hypothetical protein